MPVFPLLPQAQAYGYPIGILLLDLVETHVPGDTAHTATYGYPVLFKVVTEATVDRVTHGDRAVEAALIAAAQELERAGVCAISTNCGFMIHYQEAVRAAVRIPVFLSSLLQLPTAVRTMRPDQTLAIMTAFKERLTPEVLRLAGLPEGQKIAVNSIQTSPEFLNMGHEDLDTDAFEARMLAAVEEIFATAAQKGEDIGAVVLECAVFTPYAAAIQARFKVPVFDFISLIDYAHYVTHRRRYF